MFLFNKFWLLSLTIFLIGAFVLTVTRAVSEEVNAIASLIIMVLLIHVLANRIREFGSNPWLALWAILPFVGLIQAFYYGCKESGTITKEE